MSQVKIHLTNFEGKVIEEREVTLTDGDSLIIRVPDDITKRDAQLLVAGFDKVLKGEAKFAIVPESVKLEVLKRVSE